MARVTEDRVDLLTIAYGDVTNPDTQRQLGAFPRWMNAVAKEYPTIYWNYGARIEGDVNCDDQEEHIMTGMKMGEEYPEIHLVVIESPLVGLTAAGMNSAMTFTIDHDPRAEEQEQKLAAQNALYDDLNPAQKEAVLATEGPVLVLAGAGTGKTRVLTTRLAHLLQSNLAFPGQILAVTFTNKAAQEMKNRVSATMGGMPVEGWWLGTFHSLAARMLRHHAGLVGLDSNFTILDADDQVRLCKQLLEEYQIDPKKNPPKTVADIISSWKDKGKTPSDIQASEVGDFANGVK
ncbi:unnamed protein product [Cyprideis torosa]|uniref:Uncharacterized protein n=1 Tax=Cyprideis torosa TaxID=163714 RepID=A0A7R8WAY7_9CRUS|nr:unnamed protein product [Cyprideis torosa]CAG0891589.1 unnamed protein product [Cyprideis torosa]